MEKIKSNHFKPIKFNLNPKNGIISKPANVWSRNLSEMKGFFIDSKKQNDILKNSNPVIYEVFEYKMPEKNGHLNPVTTVLYPGKVGNEFFMTKGHYHANRFRAEVYFILQGKGVLLMQTDDGQSNYQIFQKNDLLYIPPCWAHRMVNTSFDENLVFYGVYPSDSGHDYGTIEESGFINKVLFCSSKDGFKVI